MAKNTILWVDDEIEFLQPHILFLKEKDSEGEWYDLWITYINLYTTDFVGALRFPTVETHEKGIHDGGITWTELYWKAIPNSPIPNWNLSIIGIYANDEMLRITGYPREEFIGTDFRKYLDKGSLELVADRYRRRQRGEDVPSRYEFNFPSTVSAAQGKPIPSGTPLREVTTPALAATALTAGIAAAARFLRRREKMNPKT